MHNLNPRDEYLTELLYKPYDNEPFYKYTLRMRIKEIKAKDTIYEDFYIRHIWMSHRLGERPSDSRLNPLNWIKKIFSKFF
jgi:hypothetical protein